MSSYSPRQYSHQQNDMMMYDTFHRGALWVVVIVVIIVILIDLWFVYKSLNGGLAANLSPSWVSSIQALFVIWLILYIILAYGVLCALKSDLSSWNDKIAIGILFLVVLALSVVYFYYVFTVGDYQGALAFITLDLLLTIFLFLYTSHSGHHGGWAIIVFLIWLAIVSLCTLKWGDQLMTSVQGQQY